MARAKYPWHSVHQSRHHNNDACSEGNGIDPLLLQVVDDPSPHDVAARERSILSIENPELDELSNALHRGARSLRKLLLRQPVIAHGDENRSTHEGGRVRHEGIVTGL